MESIVFSTNLCRRFIVKSMSFECPFFIVKSMSFECPFWTASGHRLLQDVLLGWLVDDEYHIRRARHGADN